MLIREKTGFYAGQVREFPSAIGQMLIRSGRAHDPFAAPADPPKIQALPPRAAPKLAGKARTPRETESR